MTTTLRSARRRRAVSWAVFVLVLLGAALAFRKELVAWFSGKSMNGREGAAVTAHAEPFVLKAAFESDPPAQNGNALVLEVRDGAGKPIDDAKVEVAYDMAAMGSMAEMKGGAKVEHEGSGRYRAEFDLPMAGTWMLKTKVEAPMGSASQDFSMTVGTKGLSVMGGSSSTSTTASSRNRIAPVQFPPIALDSLRGAMDATDRVRGFLSKDQLTGVADSARAAREAIKAASGSLPGERKDLVDAAAASMHEAEHVEKASSLDEARKAFAGLNATFLPLVGADTRLAQGWHVFECPMFEHAQWMQRQPAKENPYMGAKMLTCGNPSDWQPTPSATESTAASGEIDHYTCSMHPSVKQQGPGKCPICGMDLIPVTKEQQEQGVVMIDDARRQLIGVRTGTVIEGPLRQSFRAVGQVTYDESKLTDVTLKVQGFITKLFVSQTGQRVATGQSLFSLYSPELYNAQQDFLLANRGASGASGASGAATSTPRLDLGRAARQRLHLLGLSDTQIANIEKSGTPMENITISSPASGFVIEKNVVEGAAVDPGMRLFRIAALNKVWVEADVYEGDLGHVRTGQSATVTLDYFPGRSYAAKVAYIYPYLDPKNRTGRVRVELANKDLDLRPGMYASVELAADAQPKLQVPAAAVVYTGPRRLVFLDLGQGRFKPQEIRVGLQANGMYEVLEGLHAGDVVATSGVFLIAAEARISTAAKYWDDMGDESAESAPPSGSAGTTATEPMPTARPAGLPKAMAAHPRMPMSAAPAPSAAAAPSLPSTSPPAAVYSCPMHPEVRSSVPGKCPKCGMDLERLPSGGSK